MSPGLDKWQGMEPRRRRAGLDSRQDANRLAAPAPGPQEVHLGYGEEAVGACRVSPGSSEALGPIHEAQEMLRAVPASQVWLDRREGGPEVT